MISEDRLRQASGTPALCWTRASPTRTNVITPSPPAFLNRMEALLRRRKRAGVPGPQGAWPASSCWGNDFPVHQCPGTGGILLGGYLNKLEAPSIIDSHNDVSEATHRYRLSEIPSGYWETDRYEAETTGDELYENEAGEYLSFSYQYVTEDTESMLSLFFFVDEMEQKTVSINGTPADYYFDNTGTHSTHWSGRTLKQKPCSLCPPT